MIRSAEILSVGTELLLGQIANTDAQFLSQQLSAFGINVYRTVTVGDNTARVRQALNESLANADMVITTGGLGPTMDDLTKETVAETFGLEMKRDEYWYDWLLHHFEEIGREMTPNNEKQAWFPIGSRILYNRCGTAPGCIVEKNGKVVVILPGPPRELQDMFLHSVVPYLQEQSDEPIFSHVLHFYGIGESALEYRLRDLIATQSNPTIAPYAKQGEVTLRITAKCADEQEAEDLIAPVQKAILDDVGEYCYSLDDRSMPEVVAELLLEKGKTLALAESCTGGMIASHLIDIPGISQALLEGQVVYSNEAKVRRLGVKEETLAAYGAVSEQTAMEMAQGLRKTVKSDLTLSVTGIAGPDGGTKEKPVGLVYIGLDSEFGTRVEECHFRGNRSSVRNASMLKGLDMIRRALLKM